MTAAQPPVGDDEHPLTRQKREPEYVRAAKLFRAAIRSNPRQYPVGSEISAQRLIVALTGVTKSTAQNALGWLVEHGELAPSATGSVILPEPSPTTDELLDTARRNLAVAARCLDLLREGLDR